MTDSFKLRFIDWHKNPMVYLINLVTMLVVVILYSLMASISVGFIMLLFLHFILLTFFIISCALSSYNTLTILANNFWHILLSNSLFVFWVCDILISIPVFMVIVCLTKNALISFCALAVLVLISIFASRKVAQYFKTKITALVF